ncbi:carbohydrate ABC transporter permease [Breznakiella homolactica]|uniref:Carbohydrate ABC transporter permease n=1 Tax=Breznakiella homolactica TaxID=2798577 RepID=A0A7T7XPV7_9SPIR|nr:carbohydrate ABC transporter permease [Breznakiella homolactica]QQO10305.1 carbohydrate ABC transporter permease [Breznakiella homolactica]
MSTIKHRPRGTAVLIYSLAFLLCAVSIFPLVWMIATSLSVPPGYTRTSGFANYARVAQLIPLVQNFLNSMFTAVIGTILTVFFCALGGFGFAKYKFPGRNFLFMLLLFTMLIPPETGVVPTFIIMRKLGLINSLWSLIIPRAATAIGIFYMRQYISSFPDEIIESARIDGCREFAIFTRIVSPVIVPALSSWGALSLIARWNDFFWPLIFMRSREKFTLMPAIAMLPVSEGLSTPWPVIMAGTTIAVVPLILAYFFLQRFQIEGLTLGSTKG